jgi:hypothetical protein
VTRATNSTAGAELQGFLIRLIISLAPPLRAELAIAAATSACNDCRVFCRDLLEGDLIDVQVDSPHLRRQRSELLPSAMRGGAPCSVASLPGSGLRKKASRIDIARNHSDYLLPMKKPAHLPLFSATAAPTCQTARSISLPNRVSFHPGKQSHG